tara:strand:- start:54 stop:470 length:417 start_codon:yes stop_codon:yes gene_type:complete
MNILSASYVISLVIFLVFFKTPEMSDVYLVTVWALILLGMTIIFTIVGIIFVRKQFEIKFSYVPILKYTGTVVFASIITQYVSEKVLIYNESIFDFIPQVIPLLVLGGGIYFGITYLIDNSTKLLFHSIINEIRRKFA